MLMVLEKQTRWVTGARPQDDPPPGLARTPTAQVASSSPSSSCHSRPETGLASTRGTDSKYLCTFFYPAIIDHFSLRI